MKSLCPILCSKCCSFRASPGRGVVLITAGLFVQLEDEEIMSVLGHEFGHLKRRDPLWLNHLPAAHTFSGFM